MHNGVNNGMRLLLVSDDAHDLLLAQHALRPYHLDWHVTTATSAAAARAALANQPFDVVIAEQHVLVGDGATLLDHVRLLYPRTQRLLLQGATDLIERISHVCDAQVAPAHPSSLREAFDRLVHVP